MDANDLPQYNRAHELEVLSRIYVERNLPPAWVLTPPRRDYGVDFIVEIMDEGTTTGLRFNLQLKATANIQIAHGFVQYRCKATTLRYFLQLLEPTLFLVYDSKADKGYCLWIKDFLRKHYSHTLSVHSKKYITIHIPLSSVLNPSSIFQYLRDTRREFEEFENRRNTIYAAPSNEGIDPSNLTKELIDAHIADIVSLNSLDNDDAEKPHIEVQLVNQDQKLELDLALSAGYSRQNSKGDWYYLHSKEVTLKSGRKQVIYYFSRTPDSNFRLDAVPSDRVCAENTQTGLLLLKKK